MDELHVRVVEGEAEVELSFFDLDGKVRDLEGPGRSEGRFPLDRVEEGDGGGGADAST